MIQRGIVNEIVNKFLYERKEDYENDYSSGFLSGVQESLIIIAESEGWTESDIRRYFNKII